MIYHIDHQDKEWAAQERLCRRLGVPFTYARGEGRPFDANKAVFAQLIRKPWLIFRAMTVSNEYWTCRYYIDLLRKEADYLQNSENYGMIINIMDQVGENLIHEQPKDWPEILGLISQKLQHLRYHHEINGWNWRELNSTSDNIFLDETEGSTQEQAALGQANKRV
ncbi:MAG: hypothetical protein FWF83_06090 [Clostridiales bacterium]|nr:hypothetical protein [Clostridiales bacterium]